MRKWLLLLLLLGTGYYVFTRYPVVDAILGQLTQAHMKAFIDEQNRQSNGFVERMKASGDAFIERRFTSATKAKRTAPPPRPAPAKPPPKPPTPEELWAQEEAQRKRRIEKMFTPWPGALTTDSGLTYVLVTKKDSGKKPGLNASVLVHFSVWTKDGEIFESTYEERGGSPTILHLPRLVPGLREGLTLMREGEVAKFWIPAKLAYGQEPEQLGAPAGALFADVALKQVLAR